MHFTSITITNLFSYYHENTLFLKENKQCNITVIMGRNGYGKTSFINSIKMLFIDTAEEIRRTIQRKRVPTPKQFVMGIANEWWGILNQQAKQEGETICSISASWIDSEGYYIDAKRTWDLARSHESNLRIEHSVYGLLINDEANNFLKNILPKSFLPFFFFDGEDILAIAEANDNEIIKKMELLLNIRPLENMQEALYTLSKEWKKKGKDYSVLSKLIDKEESIARQEDKKAEYKQKINDLSVNIEEYKYQLKKINRRLLWLRDYKEQESGINFKKNKKKKEKQRIEILEDLAMNWKQDAILAINPNLIKKAINKIKSISTNNKSDISTENHLINIFTTPPFSQPKLTLHQVNFYSNRIIHELNTIRRKNNIEKNFNIAILQLEHHKNSYYTDLLRKKTNNAKYLYEEIKKINNNIKSIDFLSKRKKQEYLTLLKKEDILKERIFKLESKKYINKKELDRLRHSITSSTNELRKLEKNLHIATEFRQQYDFALRLKNALEEVKKRLKIIKRKELEETYNKHLSTLLDSHGLIQKVAISEDFEISYHDQQGNEIGMSTMSAGMKQLSATALLWALKDISGREFPIIIDTPMGRIDAKHQENLLKQYYPNVGKQVILLPTDSELDERKYQLLKPSICKLYQLHNPTGRSSEIKEKKEY